MPLKSTEEQIALLSKTNMQTAVCRYIMRHYFIVLNVLLHKEIPVLTLLCS